MLVERGDAAERFHDDARGLRVAAAPAFVHTEVTEVARVGVEAGGVGDDREVIDGVDAIFAQAKGRNDAVVPKVALQRRPGGGNLPLLHAEGEPAFTHGRRIAVVPLTGGGKVGPEIQRRIRFEQSAVRVFDAAALGVAEEVAGKEVGVVVGGEIDRNRPEEVGVGDDLVAITQRTRRLQHRPVFLVATEPVTPEPFHPSRLAREIELIGELRAIVVVEHRLHKNLRFGAADERAEKIRVGPAVEQALVGVDLKNRSDAVLLGDEATAVFMRVLAIPAGLQREHVARRVDEPLLEVEVEIVGAHPVIVWGRGVDRGPIID